LCGQKKLIDHLLKGHDGDYYGQLVDMSLSVEDLVQLAKGETLSNQDFRGLADVKFGKIQVMLYEQLLSKYESFLLLMNKFGGYFENESWLIDFEVERIAPKKIESLFKKYLKQHGFGKLNVGPMGSKLTLSADDPGSKGGVDPELKNLISKELEDVSMKLLVVNANFRSLILKLLLRDPLLTFCGYFDKSNEDRYLKSDHFISTIHEKFSSYNYLFDQIQKGSSQQDSDDQTQLK
jgi:hypothetical protein